jgi:hypothetical protein
MSSGLTQCTRFNSSGVPNRLSQVRLSLEQGQRPRVETVEMWQIEEEEDQSAGAAGVGGRLHFGKRSRAVRTHRAELAVEIGAIGAKVPQRVGRDPVAMRPIEAGAGEEPPLSAIKPHVEAVAVVFQLVDPSVA